MRVYRAWGGVAASVGLSLLLVACGGGGSGSGVDGDDGSDGGGGSGDTVSAAGASQKGPFRSGGTSTAIRLNADGSLSGDQVTGGISERGAYQISGIDWTGPTLIRMEGDFYDEVAGNFSSDSRTLTAVTAIESGISPDINVNLYTYFAAERARSLMENGEAFSDALSTARSELQSVLGISSAPSELNLLEAIDGVTDDSANLLLFSAAVQQGNIGQDGIDALAADFADDGQINGDGADELSTIQDEGTDQLLSDARMQLKNQYSSEPPSGSGGGFGWELSACASAKLTEPRVFCSGEEYNGTFGDDDGKAILFFPEKSGFYSFSVSGSELFSYGGGWTLKTEDLSGSKVGDATDKDGDTTTLSLTAQNQYAFSLDLAGLSALLDSFTLSGEQVSQGKALDPMVVETGQTYDAKVGKVFTSSSQGNGSATSWYRLEAASGTVTVETAYDLPAVSGSGGLQIEVYQGSPDQTSINNLNDLSQLDSVNADGGSSNSLQVTLGADKSHFILVTNSFTDFRRVNSGLSEAVGPVGFELTVTEN